MGNPRGEIELKTGEKEENGAKNHVTIIEDSDSDEDDLSQNLPDLISPEASTRINEPKTQPDTISTPQVESPTPSGDDANTSEDFSIEPNKMENGTNFETDASDQCDSDESHAKTFEAANIGDERDVSADKDAETETRVREINGFEIMSDDTVKELDEAFNIFDFDGDGLITHNDLQKIFIALDVEKSDREITSMLAEGSKPLDFEGFVKLIGTRVAELDSEDVLVEALSKWDYDKSGYIPLIRFRDDLMNKGECFTEQEVRFALEKAPIIKKRGVKMIEYSTFCNSIGGMRKKFF